MDDYGAKKVIKKYKTILISTLIVLAIALIVLMIFSINFNIVVCFITYYIIGRAIKIKLYNKYINSALTIELNPQKYSAILNEGKICSNHYLETITSAYMLGDYQKTINICTNLFDNQKLKRYKYYYLVYIARCYFLTNDLQSLMEICKKFEEIVSKEKNESKIKEKFRVFELYNNYLNENYNSCKEYLISQKNNPKFSKDKFSQITFDFSLAIIDYKCGNFESAKQKFNNIIAIAPHINLATISKNYINAIESKSEYVYTQEEICIDIEYELPNTESVNKLSKKRKIVWLCTLLSLSLIVFAQFLLPRQPVHFKGLDYYSTRRDTISLYGEPDEIKEFIYPKGRFYDSYEKTFLGVKGELKVEYFDNTEYISNIQFVIDSKDYNSISEYQKAVKKTYKYFNRNLPSNLKTVHSKENDISIFWSFDKYGYAYGIYNTEIIPDSGFISSDDDISEGMVFQFNTYRASK